MRDGPELLSVGSWRDAGEPEPDRLYRDERWTVISGYWHRLPSDREISEMEARD